MYEHGTGDAAAAGGIGAFGHSHVIAGDDGHDLIALHFGKLGGHAEIHNVSGIILYDHQYALVSADRMDRFEDAVGRRGREHIARDCRIEHTEPNIARVRRFMAAAAAGNDGDLFLVRLAARDHLKAGDVF